MFKPIVTFEPVAAHIVNSIVASLGSTGAMIAGLTNIDLTAGCGVIDGHTRCLWTKEGYRVEVWMSSDGGFGASKSDEVDPLYQENRHA